tara:strand:+ start:634 stop:834 length:201 start_codon:yes stop_codon:yes gene_type:complete
VEAWGKRRYEKYFVSKLTDADAEQYETQHWIETAVDSGYINDDISNRTRLSQWHNKFDKRLAFRNN